MSLSFASTPEQFLAVCQREGIVLYAAGNKLCASGTAPQYPDSFVEYLRCHKRELLALLDTDAPAEGQTTRPDSQTGLLGDPDAKRGVSGSISASIATAPNTAEHTDEDDAISQDQQRVVAALVTAWQAGTLPDPAEPVTIAQGTTVRSPRRWLDLNMPRIERLRAKYGACHWFKPDPRRPLIDQTAPDLAEALLLLARWHGGR